MTIAKDAQPILKRLVDTKTRRERDLIYLFLEFETTEPLVNSVSFSISISESVMNLSRFNPLDMELQKTRDTLRDESLPAWDEAAAALLARYR